MIKVLVFGYRLQNKKLPNLILIGKGVGYFDQIKNNPKVLKQTLDMIKESGIDVKKYRQEYELKFSGDAVRRKEDLIQKIITGYALKMAVKDILKNQEKVVLSPKSEKNIKKEDAKNIINIIQDSMI